MHARILYPAIVLASMALAGALFWPRLAHRGPRAERLPTPPHVEPPRASSAAPSTSAEPPVVTAPLPESPRDCPSGMVLVTGDHCPFVAHKCKKQRKGSDVCEAYEPEVLCEGTIRSARFCVDELEYPNQRGMKPAVLVDFAEAKRACEVEDKRLCTVDEWQFACEGEAMLPLPTGIERSNQRCNVDRPDPAPILGALHDPFSVASEMDRIDGRVGAGTLACTSPFGVHDLVGNVEEWADNPAGSSRERPFRSAVVGGAWGAGAAACRTVLTDVPATFTSHHRGFRCCADAAGDPSRPAHEPHKSPGGFRPLSLARRAPPSR